MNVKKFIEMATEKTVNIHVVKQICDNYERKLSGTSLDSVVDKLNVIINTDKDTMISALIAYRDKLIDEMLEDSNDNIANK